MKRVAVTGANGNLGTELVRIGCVPLECDITDPDQIQDAVDRVEPDVIINAAAKTNVDACETKEGENQAIAVNLWGIWHLREVYDGQIIHLSTSYIFNGRRGPYKERGKIDPLQAYGFSKLAGEACFRSYEKDHPSDVIVRTVGLYGGEKADFAALILYHLTKGEELHVLKNLKFNPTYIPHLAEALKVLTDIPYPPKVINIASEKSISRYKFAQMIAEVFGLDKKLLIPTTEIDDWVAERPKKAGLRVNLAKKLGLPIYSVLAGLKSWKYKWEYQQAS